MGNGIQLPATQAGNFEDPDAQAVRARPSGLETLTKTTNFSKKELKILYRGFKQACPTGMVNEDKFKEVFAQFFPQGDANAYAHYVFRVFDMDQSGAISFEEFVTGISVLLRGSLREKLLWTFTLYDTNGDGVITKDELMDIVTSVYDMMGSFTEPRVKDSTARDHVEMVFQFLNSSGSGVLTEDEFLEKCEQNEIIVSSMTVFDTVV